MNTTKTSEETIRFNLKIGVSVIIAVLLALATLQGCSAKPNGCRQTRNFSGYGAVEQNCAPIEWEDIDTPERKAEKLKRVKANSLSIGEIDPHEYQLEITLDSIYIYQNNRFVKAIPHGVNGQFDNVIMEDNL